MTTSGERSSPSREPRVSVIMPAFNSAPHVREAIDSVLRQSFTDFELVIVDDGSTDGTSDILARYADPRITVIRHDRNEGVVAARNHAVAAARAPWLAFLDADDVAMPDRLARQIEYLEQHPGVDLLGTEFVRIDTAGRPIRQSIPRPTDDARLKWTLHFANQFTNSSVMLRRTAFERVGGYEAGQVCAQDYGLWARVAHFGRLATLPAVLVQYRETPTGITQTQRERQQAEIRRISTALIQRIVPAGFAAADIALLQMLVVADTAGLATLGWTRLQTRQLNTITGGLDVLLDRFCSLYVPNAAEWPAFQRWAREYVARRLLRTAAAWSRRHAATRFGALPRQLCGAAARIDSAVLRDRRALTTAARAVLRRRARTTPGTPAMTAGSRA